MKFNRPCLTCGELARDTYCPKHRAEVDRVRERKRTNNLQRQQKKQTLYGGDYRARRREALAGAVICHICQQPFTSNDRIEADHLFPGDPNSPLLPAHRLCNQRRGNKPLT